jgi:hypothetical protein
MKVLVSAMAAFVLAAASSAAASSSSRPTLRVTRMQPPTVTGAAFHARERVKVTFDVGAQRLVRFVRTTRLGAFTATAAGGELDRCGDLLLVRAVGARGDRATIKLQLPDCPPQP